MSGTGRGRVCSFAQGAPGGKGELGEVYCRQGQEHQLCLTLVHGRNSGLKRTLLFGFFQVIPRMEAGHCSRLGATGLNKIPGHSTDGGRALLNGAEQDSPGLLGLRPEGEPTINRIQIKEILNYGMCSKSYIEEGAF